jgi:hypothetical protein
MFEFLTIAICSILSKILYSFVIEDRKRVVSNWAKSKNQTIEKLEIRWFKKGPFFGTTSSGQLVFFATVKNREGKLRNVYIRVGGFFSGFLSDEKDVMWEDGGI